MPAFDPVTLGFYDREAVKYAAASGVSSQLPLFLACLSPGAHILELGCGAGHDAEAMQSAGFRVTATDGSPGLAAEADKRVAGGVRVMRFDELDVVEGFDAVWANACLLHVPSDQLAGILRKIWLALRCDGVFFASFKAGQGGGRDRFDRYYNFPNEAELRRAYLSAGGWSDLDFGGNLGGGYDGVERTWLGCLARKASR